MTDSNMKVKCNLLTGGLPVRWRLRRKKYGHCFHFHPHPASPRPWHREPLQDRLILLSFMKQLWPVENLNQSSAAKCILAVLLSARISGDTGGCTSAYGTGLGFGQWLCSPREPRGSRCPLPASQTVVTDTVLSSAVATGLNIRAGQGMNRQKEIKCDKTKPPDNKEPVYVPLQRVI